ncbi:F-actin-uncapping protein LRRC16A-like isoform X6 [Mytilus californianus]|uniref:F-actin-uncapping protein LRRC16A-like isoform X6 n=1 Tax=Mytilus californianus TaxID=6549 RepID=UPI0022456B35|nr:F-actin-uncapping protein LRRC16A-like isoform X6 [Mytilus californianus]
MAAVNNVPKDLQDAIREYLGRRIKLYIKRMVKQEVRPDKWENRVLAFSGTRLFVFTSKPSKSPEKKWSTKQEHNICYLDIQSIESQAQNKLVITTNEGKSYSFVTLETETDEINHMITHVGTSIKQIFPSFPIERIMKKIDVHPPERLKMMNDMIKTIEQKEHGPCGNFAMMYACMCDYFNLPYREEVAWDVDTIYLSQDCRVLTLKDFDHLSGKDLQPIVSAIEHNTWFTGLDLSGVKMTGETQAEVLKVMHKNCLIEDINLSNTGITVTLLVQYFREFVVKLGTAILSNTGSQLTRIDLSKNLLDDRAMISFLGSLSNLSRGLSHLNISNTKLTGKGLNKIFELMTQHDAIFGGLQVLNISDNSTKGEDLQNMYRFLGNPNNITHLDLSGIECALENLMVALQRGCTSLTHLYLSKNVYTHKKKEIAVQPSWKQFFASTCSLEYLDMSSCKIPVDALKELMLGISSNMHLTNLHLNVAGNDFQQSGSMNIESTIANIHNIASLDISNNNLDQGLATLLPWIKTNKSLKRLSIGRNFEHVKQKQLPTVLDGIVQLIQDEDCDLESLSLADSKLKHHISLVINALGSNGSLTELDISGNQMGDFGARMLSKALQINNKLKTIIWDKNGVTSQGFEDVADALEKNFTMKKMPTPVNDMVLAQQRNPEKTEAAIQRIEALLQRNHSPQKYLVNRDYKIQGCYLSSTQQMVDRLVVQVQDTVNALQMTPSVDDYKQDIDVANGFVKDANTSQLLLPQLQDVADKSTGEDNPVGKRLKELSDDLKKVLDNQMKKTVEDMLECTTKQFTAITKDKEFSTELNSGCYKKSSLPEDFATHTLNVIEMDVFNKISELNLAVAAHISDRVIDAVIENLSSSHKKLTNHLNLEKSKQGRPVKKEEIKEIEKGDKQEKDSTDDLKSMDSKSSDSSPAMRPNKETPNIASKRKTVNNRRQRPPTVIEAEHVIKALEVYNSVNPDTTPSPSPDVPPSTSNVHDIAMTTVKDAKETKKVEQRNGKKVGSQEDLTKVPDLDVLPVEKIIETIADKPVAKSLDKTAAKPVDKVVPKTPAKNLKADPPLSSLPDLDTVAPLTHLGKDRPRRLRTHRPGRPTTPASSLVEKDKDASDADNNIDIFFKSTIVKDQVTTPAQSKTETIKEAKEGKKVVRKQSNDGKHDGGKSWFGNKDKKEKETPPKDQKSKTLFGKLPFGKKTVKAEPEKKEDVKVEKDPPSETKENTPNKENTEPEVKEEPVKKEEPKEEKTQPEPEKKDEDKQPKKALRPPGGGIGLGVMGGDMLAQLRQKQQNRKSVDKTPSEETKEKEAVKPPKTETAVSPKPSETKDDTKSKEKTPISVLKLVHDQNRPKPAPRPNSNSSRTSTASRTSTIGEDGETKGQKPAPKPRPNPPPKPRGSVKSDDGEIENSGPVLKTRPNLLPKPRANVKSDPLQEDKTDSGKTNEDSKAASLPRNIPPVIQKADRGSRPVSMFTNSKNEKVLDQTLQPSKSSGDLTETDNIVQDLKEIVEDKNEENGENFDGDDKEKGVSLKNSKKEEVNNVESKDENGAKKPAENGAKKPAENGDSKRSSDESVSEESNEEKPTDFESDVIMV